VNASGGQAISGNRDSVLHLGQAITFCVPLTIFTVPLRLNLPQVAQNGFLHAGQKRLPLIE
jgi:hypothetical protein